MFVPGVGVQGDSNFGKVAGDPFKLTVHQHYGSCEASLLVDVADFAGCLDKCVQLLVGDEHGCAKLDVPGDGHKERTFVDKHDVRTDDDITVLGQDQLLWALRRIASVLSFALVACDAFLTRGVFLSPRW